jgi:chemotaxis family two-component system sensor kinase Cph1
VAETCQDEVVEASISANESLLAPGSEITLENCHREPIQTPGGIQPHGALIAVTGAAREIIQRSENALERLGVSEELLGSSLDALVSRADAAALAAPAGDTEAAGLRPRTVSIGDAHFDAFAYRIAPEVVIVEFEPTSPGATVAALADDIADVLSTLDSAQTSQELLELAARLVQRMTGFDRVWIYRFEADDHGVVIVEEREPELQPWLGLHFPARDIPAQARALFLANRIRFIPDSSGVSSPLLPLVNPITGDWPDLSAGILRAVSPMHLQYLQNMGATASMSIALEVDGRLWGLISGHHYAGPNVVEHRTRLGCEVLGRVVSSSLGSLLTAETALARAGVDQRRERVLEALVGAEGGGLADGLSQAGSALLELCSADGAAVMIGGESELIGQTPSADVVRWLLEALPDDDQAFVTDCLADDLPALAGATAPTCGLIALPLARTGQAYLLFFRNEYLRSVTWGDNGLAPAKGRLSPSGSYRTWSESVTGRSRPWSQLDRDAVSGLRAGIGTVVLQQAEDLSRANAELARSNADLQAFTFVVAHDLREPLRNMQNYLGFFLEDHGAGIPADGLDQLGTIRRLGIRMDALMDSLLDHARADRMSAELEPTSLRELVDGVLSLLGPTRVRGSVEVLTPEFWLMADRNVSTHILINLIVNAMKYSPGETPRVEVSAHPLRVASGGRGQGMAVVEVRDFGIGIAVEHHEQIFELFRRLHARDAYGGGSGAGLAIAKRLAERQGGDLWLAESTPGQGSLFCFSVPGV